MKLKEIIKYNPFDSIYYNIEINWDILEKNDDFCKMKNCQQNIYYHAEGDVFTHTKMVVSKMIELINNNIGINTEKEVLILLGAALFHDIGKASVNYKDEKGIYHNYLHELASEKITRDLLYDEDISIRESVCCLVKNHMSLHRYYENKNYIEKLIELRDKLNFIKVRECNLLNLIRLAYCDTYGAIRSENVEPILQSIKKLSLAEKISYKLGLFNYYDNNDIESDNFKVESDFSKYGLIFKKYKSNKKKITLNILIGLQGAGKTYFSEHNLKDSVVISRDKIRAEMGYCDGSKKFLLSKEGELEVTERQTKLLKEYAEKYDEITIDNMNLKKKYRISFKDMLSKYDVFVRYYFIEAENLETNYERRKGDLNCDIIKPQIRKMDFPEYGECDEFYIIKNGVILK